MPAPATTVPVVPLSDGTRRRLRLLAKRRAALEREIAQAIVESRDERGSLREIAKELDMSHGGVAWIEQRERGEGG